jgi:hypothetical protein
MPRPASGTTIGRPDLAEVALEFFDDQNTFIGMEVLPEFPVGRQTGQYPVIPAEALANIPETKRKPRGAYTRDDFEFEMDNYACEENGFEEPIDDVEVKLYSHYFDVETMAAQVALGVVKRRQEKRVADMIFNASNFTAHGVTHEWDDATNAVPIKDVNAGKLAIEEAVGIEPNTLIISRSTFLDLGLNAQIIDRIKYTHPEVVKGELSRALLAEAFGLDQVLVGKGLYNSAKKGQTASMARLWDNEYAMLCVTNSDNNIKIPCIGRTFRWDEDSPVAVVMESYREDKTRGNVIRARQYTDEELINIATAYLFNNITT